MITPEEKEAIQNIIPGTVAPQIEAYLKKKRIKNSFNNPYNKDYIRDVLAGKENPRLERLIFQAVEYYKEKLAQQKKERKALLEIN